MAHFRQCQDFVESGPLGTGLLKLVHISQCNRTGFRYEADVEAEMRVIHMGRLHNLRHVKLPQEFRYVS